MVDFVYKGIPIIKDGIVIAVERVRSIQAPDGKYYRGVLDIDANGNKFVYNQYPSTGVTPVTPVIWDDIIPWSDSEIWEDYEAI